VNVPANAAPGDYELQFDVDPYNRVGEYYEDDNTVTSPLSLTVKDCRNISLDSLGPWIQRDNASDPASASIAVVNNPQRGNQLDLFGLGGDRSVWSRSLSGSSWSAWAQVKPAGYLKKIVAGTFEGRVALWGIGLDDQIWWTHQTDNAGHWSAWTPLDPTFRAMRDLQVIVNNDGLPEVYAFGTDGLLYRNNEYAIVAGINGGRRVWPGFSPISDGSVRLDNLAVGRDFDGRIFVFASGSDGAIWSAAHQSATPLLLFGVQTYPLSELGPMKSPSGKFIVQLATGHVAQAAGSRLTLFVVDSAGLVFQSMYQYRPCTGLICFFGSPWTDWATLPFFPQIQHVAVANDADGRQNVIANDGYLQVFNMEQPSTQSTTQWPTFAQVQPRWLRGNGISHVAVASNPDGRIELFGVAPDHSVRHNWQTPGSFTGWAY
jgi:hypothetical protein